MWQLGLLVQQPRSVWGFRVQCLPKLIEHTSLDTANKGRGKYKWSLYTFPPPLEPKFIWLLLFSCMPSISFPKAF